MGSHYIQHGKLIIDQALLDLVCPVAGFVDPDAPPEPPTPPVPIPEPKTNEIILLCDDLQQGVLSIYCRASSGNVTYHIYDESQTIVATGTNSIVHSFAFPTIATGAFYNVVFFPETPGADITHFYRTTYAGYVTNYRILFAKINAPLLTLMTSAFDGIESIVSVEFSETTTAITSLFAAFRSSSIQFIKWPPTLPNLTTAANMFHSAKKYFTFDWTTIELASPLNANLMFGYTRVRSVKFSEDFTGFTNIQQMFTYAEDLEELVMTKNFPDITSSSNLLTYSGLKGTHEVTSINPANSHGAAIYNYCRNLTKIIAPKVNHSTLFFGGYRDCTALEEIVMSETEPATQALVLSTFFGVLPSLRKLTLPLAMPNIPASNLAFNSNIRALKEITTCGDWGAFDHNFSIYSTSLEIFSQPTMKLSKLLFGGGTLALKMTTAEFDYANSGFGGTSPQISIRAQLGTAEIERIYTELPTMAKTITINDNPGFAAADHSIAQLKGWTVTGA